MNRCAFYLKLFLGSTECPEVIFMYFSSGQVEMSFWFQCLLVKIVVAHYVLWEAANSLSTVKYNNQNTVTRQKHPQHFFRKSRTAFTKSYNVWLKWSVWFIMRPTSDHTNEISHSAFQRLGLSQDYIVIAIVLSI